MYKYFILFYCTLHLFTNAYSEVNKSTYGKWEYQFVTLNKDVNKTLKSLNKSNKWNPYNKLAPPKEWDRVKEMWVKITLNKNVEKIHDPVIFMDHVNQTLQAYHDKKEIYRIGEINKEGNIEFSGYKPIFISIHNLDINIPIYMKITSNRPIIGMGIPLKIAEKSTIIWTLVKNNIKGNIVGGMLMLFALLMLIPYFSNKQDYTTLTYTIFIFTLGGYLFIRSRVTQMFIPLHVARMWIELYDLYICWGAYCCYFDLVFGKKTNNRTFKYITQLIAIYIVISFTLVASGAIEIMDTLWPFQLFFLVSMVPLFIFLGYLLLKKDKEAIIVSIGFIGFWATAILDVLIVMRVVNSEVLTADYGALFFALSLGLILYFRYVNAFKTSEHLTKNLKKEVEKQTRELRSNNVKLKELDKQKTHFFQNISHELRTPLTLILSPLEELRKTLSDNEYIQIAVKNTYRLYRLVNQLLDFQKVSSGNKKIELTQINLNSFIKSVSDYFISMGYEKKINFKVTIKPKNDLYIHGEIDSLEKIVFNYLSNALKYTPTGGTISLALKEVKNQTARILVKDTGIGIEKAKISKLFKLFSQLDEGTSREFEGTGLGLALVKELSTKMNGEVGVESSANEGSTFYVDFPIISINKKEVDVLLVDDDKLVLEQMVQYLKPNNYFVFVASNVAEAKSILTQNTVKCIVSDYEMPGEDGISLLKNTSELYKDTKKILVTGKADIEALRKATNEAKVNKIILKPINESEFSTAVKSLLSEYRKARNSVTQKQIFDFSKYTPKDWHLITNDEVEHKTEMFKDQIEGEGELILVVDDIYDMRTMIAKALSKKYTRIITAVDGDDALNKARKHKPDIIITDWMMPKKSGVELIEELKECSPTISTIPTVLLTAKSDDESKLIGAKKGANAYIGKPFDELELISTVENLLTLKRGERKIKQLNRDLSENVLKRFLPPSLVDSIVEGKSVIENSYSNESLTIMFTDICEFSKVSEDIGPQNMSRMLNKYLDEMTQIIFENDGTVDKIMGDSIMAFWGAPEKVEPIEQVKRAHSCSIKLNKKLEELNQTWASEGLPKLQKRIGLHHGPAVVGYFGGRRRSDYTAIGNTINKAQRIESMTKPGEIFVSSTVRDILQDDVKWEKVGTFNLKGLTSQEALYRIIF